jgi:hypothetical protein
MLLRTAGLPIGSILILEDFMNWVAFCLRNYGSKTDYKT